MIHIYHGDGKGKTTAAIGMAIRGAGRKRQVYFIQFLKDDSSGEIVVLRQIPEISVIHSAEFYGFVKDMTEEQKRKLSEKYKGIILDMERELEKNINERESTIILDEVLHACKYKLIEEDFLMDFLKTWGKLEKVEVVLTGREPWEEILKLADYVTEMRKEKHPFDNGVFARKGIEY